MPAAEELRPLRWYDWLLAPPRFEPAAEKDYFRGWRLPQSLALQRLAGWMAVAMYVGALTTDALFAHRLPGPALFWSFGTLGVGMGLLLTFTATHPRLTPHAHHFAFFTLLVNGCALIAVVAYTEELGLPFPHAWMLVVLIYTFVMTSMPYRHAATLGIGLVLLDNIVGIALAFPDELLADRALFDVSMLLTGLIASSTLERSSRLGWRRARQFRSQSFSDELTGLRNRRYLFEEGARRIEHAGREHLPIALLMVDVDFFKRYNDSLGHAAGDRCLQEVARLVGAGARHPLDIVVRLGGEEFAVLLFSCEQKSAVQAAEVLCRRVRDFGIPHPDAPSGKVSISVGVAATDISGKIDLELLLLLSDKALYRAKEAGRDRAGV